MTSSSAALLENLGFSYFGKPSEFSISTLKSLARTFVQGEGWEFDITDDNSAIENTWYVDYTIAVDDEGDVWATDNVNEENVRSLCRILNEAGFAEEHVLFLTQPMIERLVLNAQSRT